MSMRDAGALGAWLVERPDPILSGNGARPGPPTDKADHAVMASRELADMQEQLELLRGKARLQRDPAWVDVLDDEEAAAELRAAREIRGLWRGQQRAGARAAVRLAARERRAQHRLSVLALGERLWQQRALARRTRLQDSTARLATVYRTQLISTLVLFGVAISGIAWTSVGVHHTLVGPDGSWLAYVVEPLFCLPLLVIMGAHATAARWGRRFPAAEQRVKVYGLEAVLLVLTILVNSASVLPGLGVWQGATQLLAHLFPPVLILVAVVLQPLLSSFFADILANAHVDAPDPGGRRLTAETVNVLSMVAAIRSAVASGAMPLWEDTGLPSVSEIARFYGCEKRKAQGAHDALKMLASSTPP